ncbi:cytochrome P450 2C23-like isoform X1 [Erpetoichthys calabaricus]|uniref:cytochrome P450 2C23-like isoform X1 n=1 Tax=Erpetoichthys calabaricus TaxID=27687 RepID=UPI002234BEF9|nr:cytochrome P450 2C23-like isoform X1 [Erpetoichthys calabaricus]
MELIVTLFLAAIILGLLYMFLLKDSFRYAKMPPGPTPLPVIGNLLQVNGKTPYKSLLKLSDTYGPVITVHLGGHRAVVLVGYEAVQEALVQQADAFAGRAQFPLPLRLLGGFGLLLSNGERWKQLRRFTLSTLRDFGMGKRSIEEWIQVEARHLTEEFRKNASSPCDPTFFLSRAVSNVICSIVFGQRFEYQDKRFVFLLKLINENVRLGSSPSGQLYNVFPSMMDVLPGTFNMIKKNGTELIEFVSEMIKDHKQTLSDDDPRDYIDAFLIKMNQEKGNCDTEFHYDNLRATVLNLFLAGTETTSTTLRYGLLILMKYPHIQERVHQEIDEVIGNDQPPSMEHRKKMAFTDAVIHEIQRFIDIVPMNLPHLTTQDTSFRGYSIPAGTLVIPLLHSVLFDKTQWESPQSFNPGHFLDKNGCFKINPAFLPFSTGKRACAGEGLARMELFLFFSTLLQNFSFHFAEDPETISLLPDASSFLKLPQVYKCFVSPR